ncbi:hypothetical protein ABT299_30105 [Spirillospora sp. NPDC000708]|uniref:hypothetical protein n=1 Tax=Actinomadura TaxID=1988 RepID=UPI0016882168|nr:hypothetical protein [Actinomadura sp. RB99]MBD2900072.1 hypothetical protein [Actinomadura sp. RB99]
MNPEEADARVELAETRYLKAKKEADALLEDLFTAYVDAANAGRTADQLAKPETFTAGYIRRKLRERGVEPRKGGPKPRST